MPVRTEAVMGTLVTIHVVHSDHETGVHQAMERAFHWFQEIESRCTRFDQHSELMQLTAQIGVRVPVSAILCEAVRFSQMVAEESGGAFDPTVGHRMETRGFNREHRTGEIICTPIASRDDVSYRDIEVDAEKQTIRLDRPLVLDLGGVAKGLAVDMAARELEVFRDFAIDAGGDLYLGGSNPQGTAWSVGIRHPRRENELIDHLRVSNQAVCTSGDYERVGCHIIDLRTGGSSDEVASATVVAPGAMLADALATAAFVLGPEAGIELLTRLGVEGLIITPGLERYETRGLCHGA